MWGSKLARAAVVCYLGLFGSALAQGVLPPIIPGGTGTVTSVAINAGTNITLSGSCTGTLTINCTVNSLGGSVTLTAGTNITLTGTCTGATISCTISTSGGGGVTAGSGLTLTGSVMSLGDANFTYNPVGYVTLGASSATGGIKINAFNPNVLNNPNDNTAVDFTCAVQSYGNVNLNPLFTDSNCQQLAINTINTDSVYSVGNTNGQTLSKNTSLVLNEVGYYLGGGQKILHGYRATCFGMSDCAISTSFITFAGGPIGGDEGSGFTDVNQLSQQNFLSLSTIQTPIPHQSSCNTTLTQAVTAAAAPQTVTVASTTGCAVNDWVVVGQQLPFANSNEEAVQITAVGSGTITGIFRNNFNNVSNTITPAKVLTFNSTFQTGQDRVMVDISQTPVTAGTVSSITNNAFTGLGTSWSVGMVGGNATNIGCIYLTSDDDSVSPFNGTGAQGTLHSYYQILSVSSTTALTIASFSAAGDTSYHSVATSPGAGAYKIFPCARLLYLGNGNGNVTGLAVLETSTSTWTIGDTVETAINPYPDVSAFQYHLTGYTPGGNWRSFMDIENNGPVPFLTGIIIASQGSRAGLPFGSAAWTTALQINQAMTGIQIGPNIYGTAIQLTQGTFGSGGCPADSCSYINWGAANSPALTSDVFIGFNSTDVALNINWAGAARSLMQVIDLNSAIITGNHDLLKWPGGIQIPADAATNYQACGGTMTDTITVVTSGTATPGATVTAGSIHVAAFCNGTNWIVM